jgi:hypothetical protein
MILKRPTKRTETLFLAVLGALALLSIVLDQLPLQDAQQRLERLPASGAGFAMQPLEVSPAERTVFGTATIFRRHVTVDKSAFVLTVIDGTRNRHALHDPIYCIRGAGYEVIQTTTVAIPGGSLLRLTLRRGPLTRQLLYYFSEGKSRYTSPLKCWQAGILRRLTLGYSGPAPVLVELEPLTPELDVKPIFSRIPELVRL